MHDLNVKEILQRTNKFYVKYYLTFPCLFTKSPFSPLETFNMIPVMQDKLWKCWIVCIYLFWEKVSKFYFRQKKSPPDRFVSLLCIKHRSLSTYQKFSLLKHIIGYFKIKILRNLPTDSTRILCQSVTINSDYLSRQHRPVDFCIWAAMSLLWVSRWTSMKYFSQHSLTLRLLMSYIYGAPILDVSRSHTTTQHSR